MSSSLDVHCDVMSSFIFGREIECARCMRQIFSLLLLFRSRSFARRYSIECFFASKEDKFHRSRCCTTKTVQIFYDFNKSIGKFQTIRTISFKSVKLKVRHWLHYGSLFYYYCYFIFFSHSSRSVFHLFCRFYFHLDFSCLIDAAMCAF